ncbi:MAG: ABC transporter ATP-binding protein [Phycisphaerae bacterium]|nr:ABC transporter ATP-binding protein [Phycisphaerae bacterium]
MSIVRFNDLYKIYEMGSQQVSALNGVSLSIDRGSFWAIMGPSGSGKSTMMNILGCLDRPTAGQYMLEDKNVSDMNDDSLSEIRLRYIGFIFQSFNLIPQLTVQRNIELPLYYLGWDTEQSSARAKQMADKVGLGDRLDHRPSELSGGQMQRVAIARALAGDPHIILADEPTGNLDSTTGIQIMDVLSDLNKEGKTIIMVTHESNIAAFARNRLHMKDGRVEKIEED